MSQARDNKTQLSQKFGFNDIDRSNGKHNYAPRFIIEKIEPIFTRLYSGYNNYPSIGDKTRNVVKTFSIQDYDWDVEVPISKGEGKFKTTVGFLDMILSVRLSYTIDYEELEFEKNERTITYKEAKEFASNSWDLRRNGNEYVDHSDFIKLKTDKTLEELEASKKYYYQILPAEKSKIVYVHKFDKRCEKFVREHLLVKLFFKPPEIDRLVEILRTSDIKIFSQFVHVVSHVLTSDTQDYLETFFNQYKYSTVEYYFGSNVPIETEHRYNKISTIEMLEIFNSDDRAILYNNKGHPINESTVRFETQKTPNDEDTFDVPVKTPIWKPKRQTNTKTYRHLIEVKIAKVPISDVQTQVNYYTEYLEEQELKYMFSKLEKGYTYQYTGIQGKFLVFTNYDLHDVELEVLEKSNVAWFKLGEGFDEWYKNQTTKKATAQLVL